MLVERGADINISDFEGLTLLKLATFHKNRFDLIKFLLDNGADIEYKGIVKNDSMDFSTPLWTAATRGTIKDMEYLISKGADVNCCNNKRESLILKLLTYDPHSRRDPSMKSKEAAILLSTEKVNLDQDSLKIAVRYLDYIYFAFDDEKDKAERDINSIKYKACTSIFNQIISKISMLSKDDLKDLEDSQAFVYYVADFFHSELKKSILKEQSQDNYIYLLSSHFWNKMEFIQEILEKIDFSRYQWLLEEKEEMRQLALALSRDNSKLKGDVLKLRGDRVAQILPKLTGNSNLGGAICEFLCCEDQQSLFRTKKIDLSHQIDLSNLSILEDQCHKKQRTDYGVNDDMILRDPNIKPLGIAEAEDWSLLN